MNFSARRRGPEIPVFFSDESWERVAFTGDGEVRRLLSPPHCDKIFLDERCCAYLIHYHVDDLN